MMIAVVVDGQGGKKYRPPEQTEILLAAECETKVKALFVNSRSAYPPRTRQTLSVHAGTGRRVEYGMIHGQKCSRPGNCWLLEPLLTGHEP